MVYEGTVIRPPSEAGSVIIQATLGCSHNSCTFCPTYLEKEYREKPTEEILSNIDFFKSQYPGARRVFLADGNALRIKTDKLLKILDALENAFPELQRVGIYANARDINAKSREELESLQGGKLKIIYLGLESGSDEVLRRVKKGANSKQMIEAVHKAQDSGIKASVIGLIGLGGKSLSDVHADETARVASEMSPRFLSFLTLMIVPGTELHAQTERGDFEPLDSLEGLAELGKIVSGLEITGPGTIFRSNHASNYLSLAGTLPKDKPKLLEAIKKALEGRLPLKPEWMRGL